MNAIKNHIEKIVFFLAFAVLLWTLYSVFMGFTASKTNFISRVEQGVEPRKLEKVNPKEYQAMFGALDPSNRLKVQELVPVSSLVSEERIVCVSNEFHFIRYDPSQKIVTCQVCGVQRGSVKQDLDDDGMPNDYEVKYQLDQNRTNSFEDADGDLYMNIVEMAMKTAPNDPNSHPGYIETLYVEDIRKDTLRARFKQYGTLGQGKYLLTVQTPAGNFNAKPLGTKIPLAKNTKDDFLLLEDFEIKVQEKKEIRDEAGNLKNIIPERKWGELKVKRLLTGRTYTLLRNKVDTAVDWTATIRSSVDPDWSAKVDSAMNPSFEFRGEKYKIDTFQADWISATDLNKERYQLTSSAVNSNLNSSATNILTYALNMLKDKRTGEEVVNQIQSEDWTMSVGDGFQGFPGQGFQGQGFGPDDFYGEDPYRGVPRGGTRSPRAPRGPQNYRGPQSGPRAPQGVAPPPRPGQRTPSGPRGAGSGRLIP